MPALTAVRVATDRMVRLADGRDIHATSGAWLITHDGAIIDVVGPSQFLTRYTVVQTGDRTLPAAICDRLEQTTGLGSTRTPEDLVTAVERLARISIGSIVIDFTPGQLEEINARAVKRGRTVKQELQAVVDRIREEIFWRS